MLPHLSRICLEPAEERTREGRAAARVLVLQIDVDPLPGRGLADAIKDVTGKDVPKDAWLLVDGTAPSDARWAVLLVILFGCFAVWNVLASHSATTRTPRLRSTNA